MIEKVTALTNKSVMQIETISPVTREAQLIALYQELFPVTAAFIRSRGGSLEEAKDIFQDALVIYYEKKAESDFNVKQEPAYVLGIAKHLWYKRYREKIKAQELDEDATVATEEKEPVVSQSLLRFVELSGKKCLELLKAFYYEKLSMRTIAPRFGFSGERSATAQKYKCLEKVRNAIRERALQKEDFYE